jgi:hypothetical protein
MADTPELSDDQVRDLLPTMAEQAAARRCPHGYAEDCPYCADALAYLLDDPLSAG